METTENVEYFEHLLWENELEYQRRELAIFESFLINNVAKIPTPQYQEHMSQLHDLLRNINKILADFKAKKKEKNSKMTTSNNSELGDKGNGHVKSEACARYIREEKFYYEQNYRQFRKRFCSLVGALRFA